MTINFPVVALVFFSLVLFYIFHFKVVVLNITENLYFSRISA